MIGRTALALLALGVLPAAQAAALHQRIEHEKHVGELACVTGWSWAKAHDAVVEARCLGIGWDALLAEAMIRGADGVTALLARTKAQIPELTLSDVRRAVAQLQAENPHQDHYELPVFVEPAPPDDVPETAHPFRVGDQLARRLGGRR